MTNSTAPASDRRAVEVRDDDQEGLLAPFLGGLLLLWIVMATAVAAGVLLAFWLDANVFNVYGETFAALAPVRALA